MQTVLLEYCLLPLGSCMKYLNNQIDNRQELLTPSSSAALQAKHELGTCIHKQISLVSSCKTRL